jgi:hypothetical protein
MRIHGAVAVGRRRSGNIGRLAAATLFVALGACATQQQPAPAAAPAAAPAGGALAAATAAAPALKLLGVSEARPLALATVSITSVDRLLTNGATLAQSVVPLPIEPAGLRDMLLAQAGLSPEVAANLDLGAPSGAVVVSTGSAGATGLVMAVAARGKAEAERVVAALGKQVGQRGDVVLIDNGTGGKGWVYRDGSVIVFSDDIEALARGARLAEEARHAVVEDVTATLFPDAIARANGTDVKTAIAMLMAQMQAAQAAQTPGGAVSDRSLESVQDMMALVGDAEALELGLVVDVGKGVGLRGRLRARPATELEKVAKETQPYELDGTLLAVTPSPSFVASSSFGSFMRRQLARQREHLQASKAKGAAGALAFMDALTAGLAGQTGIAVGIAPTTPYFTGELAYPLKDGAAAAAVAGAFERLDKDAAVALMEAQVGKLPMFDWTVKKEPVSKLKTLHYTLTPSKQSGMDPDVTKKLFGKALDVYMAVAGTRLLATFGRDAKANLGKLAAAKPAAPTGALAETLAATKGRDAFFHLDLQPMVSLVGTFAKDKRAEALAKVKVPPIPVYGTAGGDGAGKFFSADFTIPPAAFAGAGVVVKSTMGAAMGGGGAVEPAPKKKGGSGKK